MKYSETGQFTPEMIKLAKKIDKDIKKLQSRGCIIASRSNSLCIYLSKDFEHAVYPGEQNTNGMPHGDYMVPNMMFSQIDDNGADDEMYFEEGYITED